MCSGIQFQDVTIFHHLTLVVAILGPRELSEARSLEFKSKSKGEVASGNGVCGKIISKFIDSTE